MVGGGERSIVNKQFVRAIFLKRGNLQVFECVLPLKSLTHLSLSQSISLSLLESSTSVILNAEKSPSSRDMNSICSSGSGGSGFTGSPILCHSSLRPLWVATDGTAGGLVKPRTLMGAAVGRREAWLGLLPTPTSSYIPAAPVAFLPPRLTHD